MSRIRTNLITNRMANGAPTVSHGLVVAGVTTVTGSINNLNLTGITTISTLDLNGDLDVDGHLNVDNASISGISSTGNIYITTGGDGRKLSFAGDGSSHYIKMDHTLNGPIINGYGGLAFETNGTNERLRITSGGDVTTTGTSTFNRQNAGFTARAGDAVSITRASGTPLEINRTGSDGQMISLLDDNTQEAAISISSGSLQFGTPNSSSPRLSITNAGIIGIGTEAPYTNGLLHCDGHLVLTAAGNAPKIIFDEYGTGTDPKAQIEMDQESSTAASMRFYTEASGTLSERLRITSTGEVKQYGFTGSTDTAVDDLVIGNTDSGTNRGMTIWSHNNQNGGIAFADNDSNFRGAIQYQHAQDRLRFIAEGEEVGMWSNQRGLMVGPTSTGDSVTSKGGAKLYHLCGATPLNGTYNSSTETPLMRCGHSFNGIFQMWMLFNGDEYHKGCRQEIIMCQGTYGYVSNSVRREHNQNALGAGLNSMDFAYQNSGSPNYYFKVTATWASGQNQPYILWSWTGHNSEYPYAL